MIFKIKPKREIQSTKCPECTGSLKYNDIIFQGIHILADSKCKECDEEFYVDTPYGHALYASYILGKRDHKLYGGNKGSLNWFGKPLKTSIINPSKEEIKLKIEIRKQRNNVIILNCIDYLYGHSLLKLLNVDSISKKHKDKGLIVIIPHFLHWMIPDYVDEIWTVDIPLSQAQKYFINLDENIKSELKRFTEVFIAKAYSHPKDFDIENFTKVSKHRFEKKKYRITFIWREDRPWITNDSLVFGLKKLGITKPMNSLQKSKVVALFKKMRRVIPDAEYTIVGLGTSFVFPRWIDDQRVGKFNDKIERKLCKIYSESRLVIGVHGSNMLLPSAHAGMTLDLLPSSRLGNFAQDILFQFNKNYDPRMLVFRYRFIPIDTNISSMSKIAQSMVEDFTKAKNYFLNV